MQSAIDRLAAEAKSRQAELTITYKPEDFEPWAISTPLIPEESLGATVEAAAEACLTAIGAA